jgi:hypothetical protein
MDPRVSELSIVRGKAHPVAWLQGSIKADYTIAPEILSISLSGENPEEMAILVNAVRDAYLNEIVNREQNELNTRLDRLKQFLRSREEILRRKRATLRQLAQSLGVQDPQALPRAHQYVIERLATIQRELTQTRTELRRAQAEALAEAAKQKALDGHAIPEKDIEEQLRKDVTIERRQLEIAQLGREYDKARRLSNNDHPAAVRAAAALAAAEQEQTERRKKLRPLLEEQLRKRARHAAQVSAAQRKERVEFLQQLEKELQKEVQTLEAETGKIKKGSIQIETLRDEVTWEEDAVRMLRGQIQTLEFELQAPSRVTLLESAASTPKKDLRALLAGGAGFAAFACMLFGVGWWGFRARRVNRAEAQ